MSDEKDRARTALLSEGTSDSARRSETITVRVGEQEIDVEVRQLPIYKFEGIDIPACLKGDDGEVLPKYEDVSGQTVANAVRLQRCCYIPGTDDQIFSAKDDVKQILKAPFDESGWFRRLASVVLYVHGVTRTPPEGVEDPALTEVQAVADDLLRAAREADEPLPRDEVADLAEKIKARLEVIDSGSAQVPSGE